MAARPDSLDLGRLNLTSGEGRRLALGVDVGAFEFGGEPYLTEPERPEVTLDVARTTGAGHALRLRFSAALEGPCMRCLQDAAPVIDIDAREVHQPSGGDELRSPYVDEEDVLDLAAWARDALVLALPQQITCRPDCAGLCPQCGEDLNEHPHEHERAPDPRWAKLRELGLDL